MPASSLKTGVIAGFISRMLMIFPTGDMHGKYVAKRQAPTNGGHGGTVPYGEGRGRCDLWGSRMRRRRRSTIRLVVNKLLSFLIYGTTSAQVQGLDHFPRENWPQPMPLLYYSYHIMAGLGTYFVALMGVSAFLLWRGKLYTTRWILWPLMLSFPLPYVATTAGWMTAEIGRQPWVVYGLMRNGDRVFEVCLGGERSVYVCWVLWECIRFWGFFFCC